MPNFIKEFLNYGDDAFVLNMGAIILVVIGDCVVIPGLLGVINARSNDSNETTQSTKEVHSNRANEPPFERVGVVGAARFLSVSSPEPIVPLMSVSPNTGWENLFE